MNRDATLLENVKFLTLGNRSHTGSSLNPRNFEKVNSIIRELEVNALIHQSSPVAIVPTVSVLHAVEPAVELEPEYGSLVEGRTCNTRIPFLACLQYESLEESKNIIQNLVKSIADSEYCAADTKYLGLFAEPVDNIDVQQCQVLAELSEWRLKMVRELSAFSSPSIVFAVEESGADIETD